MFFRNPEVVDPSGAHIMELVAAEINIEDMYKTPLGREHLLDS